MPSTLPTASYNQPGRSSARLLNVYAQTAQDKGPVELVGAPGIVTHATLAGDGRGLFVMRNILYAVAGTTLYRVGADGTATALGSLPGTDKLTFAGNGTQIVFSNRWLFDGTTTGAITDPDLPPVSAVDYVDGFVVYAAKDSGQWGCSALYDGASWDGLDFATAEAWPDDLVTLKVDHRQVFLFGAETTEIWWNSGQPGFAFERLSGGILEYGCLAPLGVAKQDNSVFWIANDRTIRRLTGQTPMRVSHHGVEERLSSYARLDDCQAFAFNWNGHVLVAFRFPAAGACWVLDVTTGEWHERCSFGRSTWNVIAAAQCHGRTYVQHADGRVGYLDDAVNTEFGEPMVRSVTYPSVYDGSARMFHSQLDVVLKEGDAPVDTRPDVQLDYSDDGGVTWTALPIRRLGATGQRRHVLRYAALGMARDRAYRVSVSNDAPFHLLDTQLEAAAGAR